MKNVLLIAFVSIASLACRKEKKFCYWMASHNGEPKQTWDHQPTQSEINDTEVQCNCTVTISYHCVPCGSSDPLGNFWGCE
jgi:hypothetical protein